MNPPNSPNLRRLFWGLLAAAWGWAIWDMWHCWPDEWRRELRRAIG